MIPTKLLVFLQPNIRFSQFDAINFIFSYILFTRGISSRLSNYLTGEKRCAKILLNFMLSQLALIITAVTFAIFFTAHGVPLTANFVQQNYDDFGIWGETYSRTDLDIIFGISVALWIFSALILSIQLRRYFKLSQNLI